LSLTTAAATARELVVGEVAATAAAAELEKEQQ